MKSKHQLYLFVLVVILLFAVSPISAQCAMCKQSAESSLKNDPHSIARGLNSGILYLMAVPYIMLMLIFRKQLKVLFYRLKAKLTHS